MPITVKCPQCGLLVAAPDTAGGKKGRCTVCGAITEIPLFNLEKEAGEPEERVAAKPPEPAPAPKIIVDNVAPLKAAQTEQTSTASTALLTEAPLTDVPIKVLPRPSEALRRRTNTPELTLAPSSRVAPAVVQKKGLSCAAIVLIVLGIFAMLGVAGGAGFYFFLWPSVRERMVQAEDAKGLGGLRGIEEAQKRYRAQKGTYAQRLSALGVVKPLQDAEGPPGPAIPFGGTYCFRILTQQGSNASGGGRSFVLKNEYALVAYPVSYILSSKTYLRGPDGAVYSKDLGPDSPTIGPTITAFDPDDSWTVESVPPPKAPGPGTPRNPINTTEQF